jgi:L-iditol 2-dehydrogenase
MKALLCYNQNTFKIEDIDKPGLSDSDMLVEMIYTGLCGSDIIKIFDASNKKPAVYGHEFVGRVVEKGKNVSKFDVGDIVAAAHHIPCYKCHYCTHGNYSMCRHFKETNIYPGAFSQFIRLSAEHIEHTTFKLSENQDIREAIFIEPLACCIRAMERVKFRKGDVFSVVGAGAMGILFVQLIRLFGCKAVAVDIDDKRLSLAKKLGAYHTVNPSKSDILSSIKKITDIGIDTAVLTVTNKYTLSDALSYIRDGGCINIFGVSGKDSCIPINFEKLYKREATIKSTYSATPETLKKAYDIIINKKINVSPLISKVMNLSNFKIGLDLMLNRKLYKAIFQL